MAHNKNKLIRQLFFLNERHLTSAFLLILQKNTRLRPWEAIGRKQREKKTTNSPGWIGTLTRVTAQLYSLAGWIGTSTRPNSKHNDDRGEKAQPQLPHTIALLRLSKQLKCSSVDRGAERQTPPHQEATVVTPGL